ncbi:MAG: SDR family NAD(P)-dependent oxidoreductase [Candidatus Binataceae bacterium]
MAPDRAHAVLLDVTDCDAISGVVSKAERGIGPIDVLVNNAGYGHEGILEESSLDDMRRQFDVNVFGAVAMIKAVLPGMRVRRSGHIVNVTSMGGFITSRASPDAQQADRRSDRRKSRAIGCKFLRSSSHSCEIRRANTSSLPRELAAVCIRSIIQQASSTTRLTNLFSGVS